MDLQVGEILQYYDKIGVAVVVVMNQPLKKGDHVRIAGADREFHQRISSIQIEQKQVEEVAPGDTAALGVDAPVKPGDRVYLMSR